MCVFSPLWKTPPPPSFRARTVRLRPGDSSPFRPDPRTWPDHMITPKVFTLTIQLAHADKRSGLFCRMRLLLSWKVLELHNQNLCQREGNFPSQFSLFDVDASLLWSPVSRNDTKRGRKLQVNDTMYFKQYLLFLQVEECSTYSFSICPHKGLGKQNYRCSECRSQISYSKSCLDLFLEKTLTRMQTHQKSGSHCALRSHDQLVWCVFVKLAKRNKILEFFPQQTSSLMCHLEISKTGNGISDRSLFSRQRVVLENRVNVTTQETTIVRYVTGTTQWSFLPGSCTTGTTNREK